MRDIPWCALIVSLLPWVCTTPCVPWCVPYLRESLLNPIISIVWSTYMLKKVIILPKYESMRRKEITSRSKGSVPGDVRGATNRRWRGSVISEKLIRPPNLSKGSDGSWDHREVSLADGKTSQQSNKKEHEWYLTWKRIRLILNDKQVYLSNLSHRRRLCKAVSNTPSSTSIPCPENQAGNQVQISHSSSCFYRK